MSGWFGTSALVLLAIIVVGGAALVAWLLRGRLFGRARSFGIVPTDTARHAQHENQRASQHAHSRLAVLETAAVDAERSLVLVRCDDIEHLIVVGGAVDFVVDADVRGRRALQKPSASVPATHERAAGVPQRDASPAEKPGAAMQTAPGEAPGQAAAAAAHAGAQPIRNGQAAGKPPGSVPPPPASQERPRRPEVPRPAAALRGEAAGDVRQARRAQADARQLRRDAMQPTMRKAPQNAPAAPPAATSQPSETLRLQPVVGRDAVAPEEPQARTERETPALARPVALPAAQIPWADAGKAESETVRPLRVDAARSAQPAAARAVPPAKAAEPTTLGDLADRLEEALAREVQSAGQQRGRLDLNLDSFDFAREKPDAERMPSPPRAMPPAPEAEPRRENRGAPERQEEAPVISLNARRKEPMDPLEDEMARLLGELTGDTNRR